jgi:hypothetical protein
MPDDWETEHGLNPGDPADAAGDLDKDGLTNLQEYLAGSDPRNPDTDGDGIPDGWEVAHGLRVYEPADANADADQDGLTNLEEYRAGTNPQNPDTDGDGLPDGMEVRETGTNPLVSEIKGIANVAEVPGAQTVATLGRWTKSGSTIYAEDRRGYVEYVIAAPAADVYRIEIEGRERYFKTPVVPMPLLVSVDGEYLDRLNLTYGNKTNGLVHCFTPWLLAGDHRVRIYWDNVSSGCSLLIQTVRLQSLLSADANGNGIKDWVEHRLKSQNGVEMPGQASSSVPAVIRSAISPFCLEGRGGFLSMMNLASGLVHLPGSGNRWYADMPATWVTNAVSFTNTLEPPQHGAGDRWYANIPLSPDNATAVEVSYQNGGLKETNRIVWEPTNLLEANNLTIRQGDALLLVVAPPGETLGSISAGRMSIEVLGVTNYTGKAKDAIAHRFDQTGTFTLTGTYTTSQGTPLTRRITVKVVSAAFNGQPACWVGKPHLWDCPDLPTEAVVENDPHLQLEQVRLLPSGGRQFRITIDAAEPRYVVARLGTNGPAMANARIEGFNFFSSSEVDVRVIERLPDGSQLIEMATVLSSVPSHILVRFEIFVGGITFDDGTIVKELTAADFNQLGEARVRFIRPASAQTSVCHRTKIYQGGVMIGEY